MEKKRKLENILRNLKIIGFLLFNLNLPKTFWINFKLLPFKTACRFPIFIFGKARLKLKGKIVINCPLEAGLLKFGYKFEMNKKEIGIAEFNLLGTMTLNGEVWFGMDVFINIEKGASLEIGHNSVVGSRCRIICSKEIIISKFGRIGYESVITDTSFHYTKNTETNIVSNHSGKIFLGNCIWIGGRSMIYKGTVTPDNCIIASNSICNRDYTLFVAENSMIGGAPAKLLRTNIVRIFDFDKEKQIFEYFKKTNSLEYLDILYY